MSENIRERFKFHERLREFINLCPEVWLILLISWNLFLSPFLNNPPAALIYGATTSFLIFKIKNYPWRKGLLTKATGIMWNELDTESFESIFTDSRVKDYVIIAPFETQVLTAKKFKYNFVPLLALAKKNELGKTNDAPVELIRKYGNNDIFYNLTKRAIWHKSYTIKRLETYILGSIGLTFLIGQHMFFEALISK